MQQQGSGFVQAAGTLAFWLNVLATYLILPFANGLSYPLVYHFTLSVYGYGHWLIQHLDWVWTVFLALLIYSVFSFVFTLLITVGGLKLASWLISTLRKDDDDDSPY